MVHNPRSIQLAACSTIHCPCRFPASPSDYLTSPSCDATCAARLGARAVRGLRSADRAGQHPAGKGACHDRTATLLTGLAFPESPRWHEDRLWFADWGAQESSPSTSTARARSSSTARRFPFSIDWLPDGRLLIVSARRASPAPGARRLAGDPCRPERPLATTPGTTSSSTAGATSTSTTSASTFPAASSPPGSSPSSPPTARRAGWPTDVAFPNGMVVTPDNSTLIIAESFAGRLTAFDIAADGSLSNRRVWADLDGDPTASASTRRAPSGTRTSRTSAASGSARAVRCCRRSSSTAAASPACSAARTAARCSWRRTSGAARRHGRGGARARCSPSRRRRRAPVGRRRAANRSEPPARGAE